MHYKLNNNEVREAIKRLCADFPSEYWQRCYREKKYPSEFVSKLTNQGYLSTLIPEEFGGLGLSISVAAAILEEIHRSGGNAGACHAQMYTMGTLLRHGSNDQKINPWSESAIEAPEFSGTNSGTSLWGTPDRILAP